MGARAKTGGCTRWWSALLVTAVFCTGCEDGGGPVIFGVGAEATWTDNPATADALGYTIAVAILQLGRGRDCDPVPSSTHVLINGQEAELAAKGEEGCLQGGLVLGPFLQDQSVTVEVRKAGHVTASATFSNLMPGTAATMSGPTELHAGDDVLIRPVHDVPTGSYGSANFYLLDDPVWRPYGTWGESKRSSDGLHVKVPAFTGRAVLMVRTTSDVEAAEVACPGFGACHASCAGALGPFFVTGVP